MNDTDMNATAREDLSRSQKKKTRRIMLWTVLGLLLVGLTLGGWHAYRIFKNSASLFAHTPAATPLPEATLLAPAFPLNSAVPDPEREAAAIAPSSTPEATAIPAPATPEPTATPKPINRLNVLLMGIDAYESGETSSGTMPHTDVIMLIAINFDENKVDLISLPGRYGQERQVERQPLTHHVHKIRSGRGISSHQQNPFIALAERTTTEEFGACYGFALMYSGSFLAEAELDQYDQARLVMGINDRLFSYPVAPGEDFDTPAVLMTYTHKGLTRMSHKYHDFIRYNLNRSKFVRDVRRPVLINTWEAAFFNFDDEKLVEIAKAAKGMGVEMIVMDDGWFGKRDDDNSGLGDWVVNEKKIKCGLPELVRQINEIGLKFGIWFEPEMVSEDSDLYRAHPDWAMEIPGRHAVRSRNQLVLDVGRKEVQDYLIERDNVQIVASGMAFMHAGIPIPREIPEFTAFIYHLTAID